MLEIKGNPQHDHNLDSISTRYKVDHKFEDTCIHMSDAEVTRQAMHNRWTNSSNKEKKPRNQRKHFNWHNNNRTYLALKPALHLPPLFLTLGKLTRRSTGRRRWWWWWGWRRARSDGSHFEVWDRKKRKGSLKHWDVGLDATPSYTRLPYSD